MAESAKVIDLRDGQEVTLPGHPVPAIVERLEKLLAEAKAGELRDLAVVTFDWNGRYRTQWTGEGQTLPLIGAIGVLQYEITSAHSQHCADEQ